MNFSQNCFWIRRYPFLVEVAVRFFSVALYLVLISSRARLATTLRSPLNFSLTADRVRGRVLVGMLADLNEDPAGLSAHPAKVIVAVEEEMQDIRSRDPIFSTQSNLAAIPIQPITSLFNSFQLFLKKISPLALSQSETRYCTNTDFDW